MISVIVPVYKVEAYLHQCLESILGQTYQNLEILLIDDGSPDKCGEICEEYARIDPRVRVFHTANQGLSAARNMGLREAKGELIGFVDSDDWIEPDMYEILLKRMEETGSDISAGGVWSEYLNTHSVYSMFDDVYPGTEAIHALICKLSNGVWNKLYKKAVWSGVLFPENHNYEEIYTIYKVVLKANSLSCVSTPLYHYRMRAGSIVHTPSMSNILDYWVSFNERYTRLSAIPEIRNDQEIIDRLKKQVAQAAVRIWRYTYGIPKDQRDYAFLHKVSGFMQNHFPAFGNKNWKWGLRASVFFSRHVNDVSFALMYAMNCICLFIKQTVKKPFPCCPQADSLPSIQRMPYLPLRQTSFS